AKEEGKKEGEEKGLKKGKIEIARNLLDILDIEIISSKTGLTIDEIKILKKEIRGNYAKINSR
ncbi:unnamed protein product, partial [marine sediment metagenome]